MSEPIHIFSHGLWRLRAEVEAMTGLQARRSWLSAGLSGAVAGWGHKPTAARARAEAGRKGLPYIAFEDGFLRSLKPGPASKPVSLVMDKSGIYYDAREPSDLETLIATGAITEAERGKAKELRALIAGKRLSKYNNGRDHLEGLGLPAGPLVVVVDQTFGDASVEGGLADAQSFAAMFEAAVSENPGATIVAKLHPEVVSGAKRGYLLDLAGRHGAPILGENVNPWALFERTRAVYTVSSQFGFEALMAGVKTVTFGAPFYAGWGLSDDRIAVPRRYVRPSLDEVVAALYLRYSRYFDPWTRQPIDCATAIDHLDFLRRHYLGNSQAAVCYGIARWKRKAVAAMLDGPHGTPLFTNNRARALAEAKSRGAAVAAWGPRAFAFREARLPCLTIEDGFIRSAGLGAAFAPPLSLVFDTDGIYYDPRTPSDIENILQHEGFDGALLARAKALRQRVLGERVTKYNLGGIGNIGQLPKDREIVLVIGQVADDWAVKLARDAGLEVEDNVNVALLETVRRRCPQAFVIFKPHPDVEQLGRPGSLTAKEEGRLADVIARTVALEPLLGVANRVETFGSLAGFEALLRGIPVTVHGRPFYAGWGLTGDMAPIPRRSRKLTIDALAAAALIVYPRYWDPVSGLACPPEIALDRLKELRARKPGLKESLGMIAGQMVIAWRRLVRPQAVHGGNPGA